MAETSQNSLGGSGRVKDRFTTYWTGSNDQRAISYAATHPNVTFPSDSNDDTRAAFRAYNDASDEETRVRHRTDLELHTGTTLGPKIWRDATRGEKLRTIKQYRDVFTQHLTIAEVMMTALPGKQRADDDAKALKEMLGLLDRMTVLVKQETEQGWEWEKGIQEQYEIKKEQGHCCLRMTFELGYAVFDDEEHDVEDDYMGRNSNMRRFFQSLKAGTVRFLV